MDIINYIHMCYSRNECSLRILPKEIISMICKYLTSRNFNFIGNVPSPFSPDICGPILGIFKDQLIFLNTLSHDSAIITLVNIYTGFKTKNIFNYTDLPCKYSGIYSCAFLNDRIYLISMIKHRKCLLFFRIKEDLTCEEPRLYNISRNIEFNKLKVYENILQVQYYDENYTSKYLFFESAQNLPGIKFLSDDTNGDRIGKIFSKLFANKNIFEV